MKHQIHNHTKEYSIAIIIHAVSKAKFDGESQKDIAEVLGVDPTNISKYKSGEQKLSRTNISLLIEKYGCPKVASGKYMQAACYDSVDEYLSSFEQRQSDIFARALTSFFADPNVLAYLAWVTSSNVLVPTEELNSPYTGCGNNDVPVLLNWLKKQCEHSEFKQWFLMAKASKPRITNGRNDTWLPNLKGGEWSKSHISGRDLILFYLLAYYLDEVCSDFPCPDNETNFTSQHITQKEVVITGDEILAFESSTLDKRTDYPLLSTNNQIIPIGDNHRYITNGTFNDEAIEEQIAKLNETKYVGANVTVYMNVKMEYRVVINEIWGKQTHTVVIKNVPQDRVINQYIKLSDFYEIEPNKEHELKEQIAIRGGFIAGALVL